MTVETLTIHDGRNENDKFEMQTPTGNWILAREQGYSPVQMLVSAVAACGGYVYRSVLENSKVEAQISKIEVSYDRDPEKKAEPVSAIQIKFTAKVAEADQEKAIRCLKLISPNCPVIQSLDPTITVTETVAFI
ncbi:OsmC family protein [Enterococcus sp. RIT-PI-f]|uniref:OsmC family protein n=1 Tax=Enterococcus sp. RIT-PI-f TaxID=1690244 RepID=UPI0006B94A4F|nr:OsmC family protein [Enterococcus sp. RIT-PI-f]KPG70157.1 peroxiredoxin [Enterococcus sp. RIT-PI-f]